MQVARLRAAAYGIMTVAVLDLAAMAWFLGAGWITLPTADAALAARLALPLTVTILLIAMVGALSVIVTTRGKDSASDFSLHCWECGTKPHFELSFCHQCGAAA